MHSFKLYTFNQYLTTLSESCIHYSFVNELFVSLSYTKNYIDDIIELKHEKTESLGAAGNSEKRKQKGKRQWCN